MARGWESKSVEEQIERASSARSQHTNRLTPEQQRLQRERRSLELARTRIKDELARANNPRQRQSLEAALRHLDAKLGSEP